MASKNERSSDLGTIHSLEGTLDSDGQLIDLSFNNGRQAGTEDELRAANSVLEANFDFIQMAWAAHRKAVNTASKQPTKA